ncbi:unnamed protein product, partial [Rotaria magnacalcarata]
MWSYICRYFLFIFSYSHQTTAQNVPFDTIVSFGDSHTDTGNAYNLTSHAWPIVPPYVE